MFHARCLRSTAFALVFLLALACFPTPAFAAQHDVVGYSTDVHSIDYGSVPNNTMSIEIDLTDYGLLVYDDGNGGEAVVGGAGIYIIGDLSVSFTAFSNTNVSNSIYSFIANPTLLTLELAPNNTTRAIEWSATVKFVSTYSGTFSNGRAPSNPNLTLTISGTMEGDGSGKDLVRNTTGTVVDPVSPGDTVRIDITDNFMDAAADFNAAAGNIYSVAITDDSGEHPVSEVFESGYTVATDDSSVYVEYTVKADAPLGGYQG